MSFPLLAVDRLTKSYGRTLALAEVSCSVRRGEVLGLIGPNGAGKTTLFECVAGVLPYDGGQIRFDGKAIAPPDRDARIFYLPDSIAPWPSQTVGWALDFATGFFGGDPAALPRVIERLELAPLLRSPIGTLSKGQRKRALLAVGMLTPHPVLLCDEPFDGLDLRQTREIGGALREHAAAGRTLFLSIHQIADAARVCDRFVLLSSGRIVGEGTAEELARNAPSPSVSPSSLEDTFLALT
jgi:ABC-type multidrug transport system ATPase subunit